jgi:translation initiation factor IF-3
MNNNRFKSKPKNFIPINEQIRAAEVKMVDEDGEMLGLMNLADGISKAKESELDLILISPNAKPPVCKIMEYGQYKYQLARKQKDAKKGQKSGIVKELKMSPIIGIHDFDVRVRQAETFLKKGNKVKVNIFFRGRANTHPEVGFAVIDRFLKTLAELGTAEETPRKIGKNIIVMISPNK